MNIFKGFIKSFYDFKSYNVFKKQSGGKSFLYSLILIIVFSIVAYVYPTYKINSTMKDLAIEYNQKIPDFQIKSGKLEVPDNKSAEIDRDKGILILDNTSDINVLIDKCKNGIILGRDSVVVRADGATTLNQKYSTMNLNLNKKDISNILNAHNGIAFAMFGFLALIFILGSYLRVLLVALIGTIYKGETTFGQRIKLSFYATTPSVVLSAIFAAVGISFKGSTILLFIIGLIFLFFGIKGIEKSELQELADEL